MRILLQFPEGLKKDAASEAEKLQREGHEVFVSSSACFGACDLCVEEAKKTGAKKIIHFGHADFLGKRKVEGIEVEYREVRVDVGKELIERIEKALVKYGKVAIVSTVQHAHEIGRVKEALERAGHRVFVKRGGAHTKYMGQILGCDALSAEKGAKKADCVLYIGSGLFHPSAIRADLPIFGANPYSGEVRRLNEEIEKFARKKKGALISAANAKTFGIFVSTKIGQFNLKGALEAKRRLEKEGKKVLVLVSNEISPSALSNFNIFGAYINTACPRIADDVELYGKPIVNLREIGELLKIVRAMK
ncbi:diphthamide biosynthesis enzyme Dph2 [Candidatus Micrarchaeota archaeon CG11_big_fil_rev_8_21_14_0_20_47_5]|nr:MAG: diphthamide biosynthesis enzyme Dph2 [Candidatus Micrarchaeota archaeon CG1_02_47_40]PIN83620.1 MAG: diphthamide biosynthesis enzyme Dph2 [Candidatus Micrarchaeota archaeon CG11_big_fil_rev_8_21_14_0_20_47_5]